MVGWVGFGFVLFALHMGTYGSTDYPYCIIGDLRFLEEQEKSGVGYGKGFQNQ